MNRRSFLGVIGLVAVPVVATILYFPSACLAISHDSGAIQAFEQQSRAETVVAESARPAQDNVSLVEWSYSGKDDNKGKGNGGSSGGSGGRFGDGIVINVHGGHNNTITININITIIIIININGSSFTINPTSLTT